MNFSDTAIRQSNEDVVLVGSLCESHDLLAAQDMPSRKLLRQLPEQDMAVLRFRHRVPGR